MLGLWPGSGVPATDCHGSQSVLSDISLLSVTLQDTSKTGASSPNTETPWPGECFSLTSLCVNDLNSDVLHLFVQNISVFYLSFYLHHTSLPTDPEAAELIRGEDTWCGDADQGLTHLAQGNPGTRILPTPEYDLQHLCTIMGTGRQRKVGIIVGLHCHLELVHPGRLFHVLILILVRGRNVDPL